MRDEKQKAFTDSLTLKEETSWTVEVVPARQQAEVNRTYALSVRFP